MSAIKQLAARARERTRRPAVAFHSLVRRLAVAASEGGSWQLLGPKDEDGAAEVAADIEVFQQIGYSSRPVAESGEVVVVKIGGALTHPVIIATRDESIRVDLDEDETAIYNSASIVKVKADGTIEIGSQGGTFAALALKSDVDTIQSQLDGHSHTYLPGSGGATTTTGNPSVTAPTGTVKLKAE
jgi:phage gp45-like